MNGERNDANETGFGGRCRGRQRRGDRGREAQSAEEGASHAAATRRCLGRVQFHVQDLTHVSSPGIDTGNSPVGRPSPEVMGTYCTQNEHLLLELTQIVYFEGLVLKTPPLLRGLCYNLSVSSERIDLFQTHLPTRGGPIRCGFGRDRMTYAILRIWLPLKTAKTFKQAEYVGCAACVQATHVACLSFVFVCRALGGASMETWI